MSKLNVKTFSAGRAQRAIEQGSVGVEIALRLDPKAQPGSYIGPPACMLHLWNSDHGLVAHTSYIGKYPGPYPFF